MLFSKFFDGLVEYGLEYFGKYYGAYRGVVADNEDPEFRGRLKLLVPQIYKEEVLDYWADSKGVFAGKQIGLFAIPNIGDGVWVSFENGDPHFPIWEYGWFPEGEVPTAAKNNGNKPTNMVWQSTAGHRIEMDDSKMLLRLTNKDGHIVEMNKDGTFTGKDISNKQPAMLGKDTAEFIKKFIGLIENAKTMTQLGPQPLLNVAEFTKLKTEVDKLLSKIVTLE